MTPPRRVGLLPAGGRADRIAPLPCSKELFPVGFRAVDPDRSLRPKVVSHFLLERMRLADVRQAYLVLRPGKWDIPAYYGDGSIVDLDLAYLVLRSFRGVPFTADQAYPFLGDALVAFGFPDILFQPDDVFVELFRRQTVTGADVVLALFPALEPEKTDLVLLGEEGRVRSIETKPHQVRLPYTWVVAVWGPEFTEFLHRHLSSLPASEPEVELSMGHVLDAAIAEGLEVNSVVFPKGLLLDIGTPDDLVRAVRGGHWPSGEGG